jgi:type II secretory pathway pseudopilin PulG
MGICCQKMEKKMKRNLSIAIIIILSISSTVFAQNLPDVIKALKKFEAKTEVGMSYRKYTEELGNLNAEVKPYLNSKEAKKILQLQKQSKR